MAVLLFAMTTAVMGCYQKETEPIDIPGRTPSGTSAPQPSATLEVIKIMVDTKVSTIIFMLL